MVSRIVLTGLGSTSPTHARKSAAPAPSPRLNRLPVSSSIVAASIASSAGWMVWGFRIPVPSSIRWVACATAPRITGALRRKRSCDTQSWSKPAASAARASRT